jgi:hypothetical protein
MYSAADYVEMLIIIFGECGRRQQEFSLIVSPDRPSPNHKTILRVLARSQEARKVCRIGMKLAEVHELHGP